MRMKRNCTVAPDDSGATVASGTRRTAWNPDDRWGEPAEFKGDRIDG
jgi:CO dehydrogenase/acetyl-CoA synthase delta subunit